MAHFPAAKGDTKSARAGTKSGRQGRPIIPKAKVQPRPADTRSDEEDEQEVEVEEEEPAEEEETTAPLPDDEEVHRREAHFQQLRQVVGVGGGADGAG